jgi:hypothetical protein
MIDEKTEPKPNDPSERGKPERAHPPAQPIQTKAPAPPTRPDQRASPGRKPLFGH